MTPRGRGGSDQPRWARHEVPATRHRSMCRRYAPRWAAGAMGRMRSSIGPGISTRTRGRGGCCDVEEPGLSVAPDGDSTLTARGFGTRRHFGTSQMARRAGVNRLTRGVTVVGPAGSGRPLDDQLEAVDLVLLLADVRVGGDLVQPHGPGRP